MNSTNELPAPVEPVAIVGMACRYGGEVSSPDDLWRLVLDERCAVTEIPGDRGWDLDRLFQANVKQPGTSATRRRREYGNDPPAA